MISQPDGRPVAYDNDFPQSQFSGGMYMSEWGYAQEDPDEQLAKLHIFSMKKLEPDKEIDVRITVHEFFTPKDPAMPFFAQADKQTNQNIAPYTPCGWGKTLLEALRLCIEEVNRFPYQGET
jgi:hypothetical protein